MATALPDFGLEFLDLRRDLLFGLVIVFQDDADREQLRPEVGFKNSFADVLVRDCLEADSCMVTQIL